MSVERTTTAEREMTAIKICIPIQHRNEGGMYTFLGNFRAWLDAQSIAHTDQFDDDYNVLFINSWAVPVDKIGQVKRTRPALRVIHRIDGVATDYGRYDAADYRQAQANLWADVTIFQSLYSRDSAHRLRVIQQDGPVIYNPVDLRLFVPGYHMGAAIAPPIRICNVSFSTGRLKGTWRIANLAQAYPELEFHLCGRYPPLPKLPNIVLHGHLNRTDLARVLRNCHLFLHLAERDPCPNVVIEALASGLPVLHLKSGGTPELVGDAGLPIDTEDNFGRQVDRLVAQYPLLSIEARRRAESHFAPDRIFSAYLAAIEQSQRRALPSATTTIQAALRGYPVLPYHPILVYRRLRCLLADYRWKKLQA